MRRELPLDGTEIFILKLPRAYSRIPRPPPFLHTLCLISDLAESYSLATKSAFQHTSSYQVRINRTDDRLVVAAGGWGKNVSIDFLAVPR